MTSSSNNNEMIREMEWCRETVENRLHELFAEAGSSYATLVESMRYSLLA